VGGGGGGGGVCFGVWGWVWWVGGGWVGVQGEVRVVRGSQSYGEEMTNTNEYAASGGTQKVLGGESKLVSSVSKGRA